MKYKIRFYLIMSVMWTSVPWSIVGFAEDGANIFNPLSSYECIFTVPTGLLKLENVYKIVGDNRCDIVPDTVTDLSGEDFITNSWTLHGTQLLTIKACAKNYLNNAEHRVYDLSINHYVPPGMTVSCKKEINTDETFETLVFDTCYKYWKANPDAMTCEKTDVNRYRNSNGNFICRPRITNQCVLTIPAGIFGKSDLAHGDGTTFMSFGMTKKSARSRVIESCANNVDNYSVNSALNSNDACLDFLDKNPSAIVCEKVEHEECLR